MALSTRIRFEVLKRDGFACQYCGARSPDVALHVDHIEPKSLGGDDDFDNYITACAKCNLGKAARPVLLVRPCAFCEEENGGLFFEIPNGKLDPASSKSTELICSECLRLAVWQFLYLLKPPKLECAGCGECFDNEAEKVFRPIDIHGGSACWICDDCRVVDDE